ncbi:splicing factor 3A subunit 2-like [Amphibalanus amphitrite]|uniref:splicing factor 3A subunit 2-like n=1 Tax=Amphibalanus amphitrite TaxID=1232801 RepID=UPI001C90A1FC|nr:splicing factor 3A subunit 2-like [Amphibalanus amphitrite]
MKCLLIASLVAVAVAAPQYGHNDYHRPYSYDYAVHTPYGGQFSQSEHSDGRSVQGRYGVQTKGGSTHVTYYGDHSHGHGHGYKPAPAYHKPAPAYHKPAPVYHKPAPVYHKPAPVYHKPAPVYHKPAPIYHAPVYKPAPAYH